MSKQNTAGAAPQENKMGVLPVGKLLAGMAVPMMISMLVQALYNIVDSVFVSRLSENAFNAVGLAFPLQSLMIAVGAGTAVGINALLSRSLGEKKQEMADRAAGAGIFLLPICSYLVFAFIGLFLSRPFFVAQAKAVPEIVEYGVQYTRICLGLSVGIFSQFCFERLLQSTGRTSLAMCTQLLGAIINIVMDPILIFGLCGAPRMGVAGAAVATVVGQIVAAIVGLIVNIKCNHDIHIHRKNIRWDPIVAKEIYRVGIPSIIMQSISSVMTFGMNKILFVFTPTATAVFGAYFKIQSFVFMPIFGLNNGMVPIISYNYGAARPQEDHPSVQHHRYGHHGRGLYHFPAVSLHAAGAVRRIGDHAGHRRSRPADHQRFLSAGRLLHHRWLGVPGHRQSGVQPDRLRVPSNGSITAGGVAAVPDWTAGVSVVVLPHRGGHVLHPEHNLPAPHRQVRQRGHEFQRGLTACLI